MLCISALIDQSTADEKTYDYKTKLNYSRSKLMLVAAWMIGCFSLINMYKSLLLAMLMTVQYEPTLDTLDDMLSSEVQIMLPADTGMKALWTSDPRDRVQALSNSVEDFKFGSNEDRDMVNAG